MRVNKLKIQVSEFKAKHLAPEPECFRIERVEGQVPKRFIRREWLNWSIGQNLDLPDGVSIRKGVEKILQAEFALEDIAKKEWKHDICQLHEDVEIFIYHVVRTRV